MNTIVKIIFLCCLLFACKSEDKQNRSPVNFDEKAVSEALTSNPLSVRGAWPTETSYENHFFKVGVSIPPDWYLTKGKDENRDEAAAEFLSGKDKNLKGVLENAIKKTITVFWVYRYPPGTPGKTNPNVSMVIEGVEQLPGIATEGDYLQALENTLKMTNRNFIFKNPPTPTKLGELDMWSRDAEAPMGNLLVKQRFYTLLKNRTILLIGLTYVSSEDEAELEKLTKSFKKLA